MMKDMMLIMQYNMRYIYYQSSVHTFEIQYLPEFTTFQIIIILIILVSSLAILIKMENVINNNEHS